MIFIKTTKIFFHASNNKANVNKAEDVALELNKAETMTVKCDLGIATTSEPMPVVIIPAVVRAE